MASRQKKRALQQVKKKIEYLTYSLQRSPTTSEVAQELQTSEEEVTEILEMKKAYAPCSLDELLGEDNDNLLGCHHDQNCEKELLEKITLGEATKMLTNREQRIVTLRYPYGMSQSEIADQLKISQMQVSRLLRSSLKKMREYINGDGIDEIFSPSGMRSDRDQMEEDLQYTVLHIEDNPSSVLLVSGILSTRPDITFLSAGDAELGIELAQARCPDLILMDINLPGMDGIAATKQLQIYKETRKIPVIAVSAYATEAEKKKAMAAGFKDYITKPFKISELLEPIDEILKQTLQRL